MRQSIASLSHTAPPVVTVNGKPVRVATITKEWCTLTHTLFINIEMPGFTEDELPSFVDLGTVMQSWRKHGA